MFISSIIISLLSLGIVASNPLMQSTFLKEEVIKLRKENSQTYITNRGTYLSFYCGTSNNDIETINSSLTESYNSSYISGKSFEVGSSVVNNSLMIIGDSQILNPVNNQTPVYNTVFNLTLPSIDASYYSIREAGFLFKKQSGQLSNIAAYKVNSPLYSEINGISSIDKDFISFVHLSSSYSVLDITNVIIESLNDQSNDLAILFQGISSNQMCYLYPCGSQYSPSFYIEYDNYGSAREYFEISTTNCMGYALYANSQIIFTNYIPTNSLFYDIDLSENTQYAINIISYVLGCCGCNNIQYIQSYNSLILSSQRRIAMRFLLDNSGKYAGDFHFMWQTKNGDWAVKPGFGECNLFNGEDAPLYDNNWRRGLNETYNSQTYYFAIEKD